MAKQYQVLARKWRPQKFEDVVGQAHVITTLKNAIEQSRLAHAYLFVGPRGIGKTSTARIFAKALNCINGPTTSPCGSCDICTEIATGTSLDVLEIDGASNRGIDEIRTLRETVRYAPARGKFKIYIIDEIHMLTKEAFNALLKTLEEPPSHVKFLFATTEPQKVLPTILSRCQRFDLRRIPVNLLVQRLKEVAVDEKVSIDEKALIAIARGAEGGLRDAESALDQMIAFCGNNILEDDVLGVFGLVGHDQIAALTDAVIDGEVNIALKELRNLDEGGKDLQRLLADLLEHFRNLLVVTLGDSSDGLTEVAETQLGLLKSQANRIHTDAVLRILDTLIGAETRIRYALSKRVFFEIALIRAIKTKEAVSIDRLLDKLNELKQQLSDGSSQEYHPSEKQNGEPRLPLKSSTVVVHESQSAYEANSETIATPTITKEKIEDAWNYAVTHLGKVAPLAKTYLIGTKPLGLSNHVLTIGFDPEFAERIEFVDNARNKDLLQSKLKERLHQDVVLKLLISDAVAPTASNVATTPRAVRVDSEQPIKASKGELEEFKNDPLIKKALEIFKGTLVEVRK